MLYGIGESPVCCGAAPQAAAAPRKGLAVLLPGFGYGPDKPLQHYARKAALAAGFEVLAVEYGPLPRDKSDLARSVRDAFVPALAAAAAQLDRALAGPPFRSVFFVSKSFGTLVAGELTARRPELAAKNFYLTPLPASLPYLAQPGGQRLAAAGTADPFVTAADRARMRAVLGDRLLVFEGADHSLEVPGDPLAGVAILEQVVAALCGMMR